MPLNDEVPSRFLAGKLKPERYQKSMEMQRLVVLFDGTWADEKKNTNVHRLKQLIECNDNKVIQECMYDTGPGTSTYDKFRGGLFGYGLSENLMQGYAWLAEKYRDGDEIWIFGFSRGAYTARSLAGLIRKCGLLKTVHDQLLREAQELYRNDKHPDAAECKEFRARHSRTPRIHFIGVWDTVGALGIPGTYLSEDGKYSFHDTELSGQVNYAYHAIALDEHRKDFDVTVWTSPDGKMKSSNLDVEQRWFIGSHSNVGGGVNTKDALANISLKWMMDKASNAGLKLEVFSIDENSWKGKIEKSIKTLFLKLVRQGGKKFHREFKLIKKDSKANIEAIAVNITVDESVINRWRDAKMNYRPETLVKSGIFS